jgi:hypothetical protein
MPQPGPEHDEVMRETSVSWHPESAPARQLLGREQLGVQPGTAILRKWCLRVVSISRAIDFGTIGHAVGILGSLLRRAAC